MAKGVHTKTDLQNFSNIRHQFAGVILGDAHQIRAVRLVDAHQRQIERGRQLQQRTVIIELCCIGRTYNIQWTIPEKPINQLLLDGIMPE